MEASRRDPDELLRIVQADERSEDRGKLRVYLGMCAGVGKTFAMLESARRAVDAGVDVVVGIVETHGRRDTESLLQDLEVIPRAAAYRLGTTIRDLDVDAVLRRRPQLVLIDELAHTNPEGWRHRRRYQDVTELLDHGINVYTTLNVQHLESRADDVERITGIRIHERVPDSIISLASEIELVDLTPEELLERLSAGKVYTPDRSEVAARHFFRRGNLVALREMALRTTAERVDNDLISYRRRHAIDSTWPTTQRYVVSIGPTPTASNLVRHAARLAHAEGAPWTAAIVRRSTAITEAQVHMLTDAVDLVERLGGTVEWIDDDDVVAGLLRIAHRINATTILIGKPRRKGILSFIMGTNLVADLLRRGKDVNVSIVAYEAHPESLWEVNKREFSLLGPSSSPRSYALTLLATFTIISTNLLLVPLVGYQAVGMILLLYISVLPLVAPRGPVLVSAIISALSWNLLFIPPRFTLAIGRLEDQLTFILYFILAVSSTWLMTRIRRREIIVRRREELTDDLYEMATELNAALTHDDIAQILDRRARSLLHAEVGLIVVHEEEGRLEIRPCDPLQLDAKELATAQWTIDHRRAAGLGTDTLPLATAQFIPIILDGAIKGALAVRPLIGNTTALRDTRRVTHIVRLIAWSMQRITLTEEAQRVYRAEDSANLTKTIINAVSHEFRTPLASLIGSATTLEDVIDENLTEEQRSLVHDIRVAAIRLDDVVGDLLSLARIDAGRMLIKPVSTDVRELIGAMRIRTQAVEHGHILFVEVDPPSPPEITIDPELTLQIMCNLVSNAYQHTPNGTSVSLSIRINPEVLDIAVDDSGSGIPSDDLSRIFDRFWHRPGSSGSGLGLSIVRELVHAMHGTVSVARSPMGGARFIVSVPVTHD